MKKTKRVEVLFEPSEYKTLEERAAADGVSVGHLVRDAVAKHVVDPRGKQRREAIKWITSQQFDFDPDWATVKKEIIEARVKAIEKSLEVD